MEKNEFHENPENLKTASEVFGLPPDSFVKFLEKQRKNAQIESEELKKRWKEALKNKKP